MSTGERIRAIRMKRGQTQKQLGDLCGMADSAIRRYESGRGNPTEKTLQRIAAALGVSADYLLSGIDEADRDYEDVCAALNSAGILIRETVMADSFYVWHEHADHPEEDQVEYTLSELVRIVRDVSARADLKRQEYVQKLLDAELF